MEIKKNTEEKPEEKDSPNRFADLQRRIGKFSIRRSFLYDHPEKVMLLMQRVIVVRCELLHLGDMFEYVAISPDFESVPEGQVPPEYDGFFSRKEDGSFSFRWVKQ